MKRMMTSLLLFALAAMPAQAHFIWIVPNETDPTKAKVVFSEDLKPDEAVPIDKIAATRLYLRDSAGKTAEIGWKKGEHVYLVRLPDASPAVVGGVCKYGVLQRGKSKPFLLAYYPKLIRCEGEGEIKAAKAWDKLPLEIVPQGEGRFQVLFGGKPAADAAVVMVPPAGKAEQSIKCDASGEFKVSSAAAGLYGIRARYIEAKAGEHDGKKYEEIRHYATLVFQVAPVKDSKKASFHNLDFPPLPQAVSSFGAAVADGWLYVYGGHCARTHQYSTKAVLGTFHRLKIGNPKSWEALPSGTALQGLALVAHQGKIYRIGGMQPRNQPGEKADNHSVAAFARFDPDTNKWENLPDLPEGRSSHDAVVAGDKIVVVGGWKMNGAGKKPDWHATALILDLKQEPLKWRSVKQPFERRALTAAVYNGKVFVGGGMSADSAVKLTVNIYDPEKPEKEAWTTGPDLPGPSRNGFSPAASEAGGRLYVSLADGKLFRLAARGDAWEEAGKLKQPRIVHRMVAVHDNLLIALGGASKGENIALSEVIRP